MSESPIVPLGSKVKPYGYVAAVLITGEERYYLLLDKHNVVSLIPANVIEPEYWKKE